MNSNSYLPRSLGRGLLVAALLQAAVPATTWAQQAPTQAARDSAAKDSVAKRRLFGKTDALWGGAFIVGTIAMFPVDTRLAKHLQNEGAQANQFFKNAAKGLEAFTAPGAYIIGGSLYAIGRIGKFDRVADLGWHGTEAVLIAQGVTSVLKGALGRARPFATSDTNATDFGAFRGFTKGSDYQSFPSGHTTTAFAAASAVTAETGRWWPKSTWVVGPLMYGGASLVGLSRMYHNKHWASDVALGAAIGTFSGWKVVQYAHDNPKNRIDHIMLHTVVAMNGDGGAVLAFSWPIGAGGHENGLPESK